MKPGNYPVIMISRVSPSFSILETQKDAILARVSSWAPEKRQFRSRPGNWCALEILDHLARVEETAIQAVKANLPDGYPVRPWHRVSGAIANVAMRSRIRIRVPKGVPTVLPDGRADLDAVAARWSQNRRLMAAMLDDLTPEQSVRGLVKHPVAGWMTIAQGMQFLSSHLTHHGYQLDRIERAVRR